MTLTLRGTLRATIAATALAAVPAPAPAATRGPCVPGQRGGLTCLLWSARAVSVRDGDTVKASIEGGAPRDVRNTGIQAVEFGQCHYTEAKRALARIVHPGDRLRLAGRSASSYSQGRPRRAIYVRRGGRWVDASRAMIRAGYVLYDPSRVESAWNGDYLRLAQRAATRRRHLWNPRACGAAPRPRARLRLLVQWDGEGPTDDEYVRIEHRGGGGPISLRGWYLRDAAQRRYLFRYGRLRPGHSVTLYVRSGPSAFQWHRPAPIFENASGDGAYLFDPRGNLRASMMFPCRYRCSDPARDRVRMTVRDDAVLIANVSARPVDLDGQQLRTSGGRVYDIGRGGQPSTVRPGETMRIAAGGDARRDSRLSRSWEFVRGLRYWTVELRTLSGLLTARSPS